MSVSSDQIYRSSSLARSAFDHPRRKPRPLYPAVVILVLSALLWAAILVPAVWLFRL
jgi:hypothetical protein